MKRLLKLTLGLLIAYVIIRILTEYLRPVRVMLDEPTIPPPPPPPPPTEPGRPNMNQANATALTALPGIGPALAERIIAHRQQAGPLTDLDDLTQVQGIGPALVKRLRPLVTLR